MKKLLLSQAFIIANSIRRRTRTQRCWDVYATRREYRDSHARGKAAVSAPSSPPIAYKEMRMRERERDIPENSIPTVGGAPHRMNRAQLLTWAGAGITLAAFPQAVGAAGIPGRLEFPFTPQVQGRYEPEDIRDIFNILDTLQHFAVAVNFSNLTGAIDPNINPVQLSSQKGAIVKNVARADFLESLGAHSLTDTFTVGPLAPFTTVSLKRAEVVITIFVGAYLAAAREFAELGQPLLVKWAFQAGASLAEERAMARALMALQNVPDTDPPDNKAFETDLFLYVRDAYALMTKLGLFGGLPVRIPYPSRDQALAIAGTSGAKVIQRVPNNATVSITSPADVTKERL